MTWDLATIWAGLIAFAVLAYVILDGFDLGVGILFPFLKSTSMKDHAMNTVAPVWDGNETWLVLGGGGLFAVFPLAYAVLMPALYIPITVMLLALIFRGVAFEFRWRTRRGQYWWDGSFFGGSLLAAFAQGVTLGALVQGIAIENRQFAGSSWDWLTPFSITTGFALVFAYAMLGACWLVMKTEGDVYDRAKKIAIWTGAATLLMVGIVSLWTPMLQAEYLERWIGRPYVFFSIWVPALMLVAAFFYVQGLNLKKDRWPFFAAIGLFLLCFIGLMISFYPNMIPPSLTFHEAAAPHESQRFLLVGASVLIPLILAYTAYAYWVFRGKLDPHGGYH